jgi:hypothetical protein
MTERQHHTSRTPEQHHAPEQQPVKAEAELDRLINQLENSVEEHHEERINDLSEEAKAEALPADEIANATEHAPAQPAASYPASQALKADNFHRMLTRTRKRLPSPVDRTISRIVHQPAVDVISRAGDKTVARPSGLLGGGILAFVGSSVLLWASRHYGFRYNYLLFFLLFLGGFVLGGLLEVAIFLLRRRRP